MSTPMPQMPPVLFVNQPVSQNSSCTVLSLQVGNQSTVTVNFGHGPQPAPTLVYLPPFGGSDSDSDSHVDGDGGDGKGSIDNDPQAQDKKIKKNKKKDKKDKKVKKDKTFFKKGKQECKHCEATTTPVNAKSDQKLFEVEQPAVEPACEPNPSDQADPSVPDEAASVDSERTLILGEVAGAEGDSEGNVPIEGEGAGSDAGHVPVESDPGQSQESRPPLHRQNAFRIPSNVCDLSNE